MRSFDEDIIISTKVKLSAVILAYTTSHALFEMTIDCLNSLIKSEPDVDLEIILVESNRNYSSSEFRYPNFVKVIIPEDEFNFHKFLNIGIRWCQGDYIALCNNDLIFHKNWFTEILKVSRANPNIKSFSPSEHDIVNSTPKDFEIGFAVQKHVKGWCIVTKREVFPTIGYLDESFSFYYADNDYAMSLRRNNIKHALVRKSRVDHLAKKSSDNILKKGLEAEYLSKYSIPKYLNVPQFEHVFETEKGLAGFLQFYGKWGTPKWVYRKNKVSNFLFNLRLGFLSKFLYSPKTNFSIYKSR